MSFCLGVWEGTRPATDAEASKIFEAVMDRMQDREEPTPRIRAYVEALLARWPDIGDDDGVDSPWSDGPLIGNASGPAFYFGMVWSQCEEAAEFASRLAEEHGLVCYDPQSERLLTARAKPPTADVPGRAPARGIWSRLLGRG